MLCHIADIVFPPSLLLVILLLHRLVCHAIPLVDCCPDGSSATHDESERDSSPKLFRKVIIDIVVIPVHLPQIVSRSIRLRQSFQHGPRLFSYDRRISILSNSIPFCGDLQS